MQVFALKSWSATMRAITIAILQLRIGTAEIAIARQAATMTRDLIMYVIPSVRIKRAAGIVLSV